jgi:hypothetical protein
VTSQCGYSILIAASAQLNGVHLTLYSGYAHLYAPVLLIINSHLPLREIEPTGWSFLIIAWAEFICSSTVLTTERKERKCLDPGLHPGLQLYYLV